MARKSNPNSLRNTIIQIKCETCGNMFETKATKSDRKYCSKSCVQKNKKIREEYLLKRNKTCLEKYGVKSPLENKDILLKYQKSLIDKYGVKSPFASGEIKQKAQNTIIKRYGTIIASQNSIIGKKISDKLKNREYPRESFSEIKWSKILAYCVESNLTPLFVCDDILNNKISDPNTKFQFQCNKCMNKTEVSIRNGYLPTCWKCSNYKGYSLIEEQIFKFILENYDGEVLLKKRGILSSTMELDIYLPEINIAIEVNGLYWHSEIWGKYPRYHLNKTEEALEKNIVLLHIWDHEWIFKKEIVKSMILNKIKKISNTIYARKCVVKEIDYQTKHQFLNENHLQGDCVSTSNIGIFHQDNLVGVMTFGQNRFNKTKGIELIRLCTKLNTNIVGGASKMLQYYIKTYKPDSIVTFADRRYSLGNVYKTIGFTFMNFTSPNYFYWKNMKVYNRISFQKHKLEKKLEKFDKNKSEYENMLDNGYNRVWDCGNYKFKMEIKKEE